ncbi:response regulator [bacterium]|nr:response regulator [bacterium]
MSNDDQVSNNEVSESTTPLKILIVDDEPIALDLAETALARQGFQTLTARTGEEGWKRILEESPDLVLLDITMPDIDGFTVFERIKQNQTTESLPVIFLSARDDMKHRLRGLEQGAVDYITKPYNVSELIARVRAILRMRRLEAELLERKKEDIRKETVKQLLTTMAHYMNNAVASIDGRVALTPDDDPEKTKKLKEVVTRQTRVISTTIYAVEKVLEKIIIPTTKYVNLDLLMLDIEEMMRTRIEELGEHDRRMGRANDGK